MTNRYFLHRISHESNTSYSLLEKGYLSLGWSLFSGTNILEAARKEGSNDFNVITDEKGQKHNRSRWCMWYFAQMDIGDTVVVPLYSGLFSVYKVLDKARDISDLEGDISTIKGKWNNNSIIWKEQLLYDEAEQRGIDLGFFIKVKPIVKNVPRKIVSGKLISRMKIRTTTAEITDIAEDVESGIKAGKENKPISLYGDVIDSLIEQMLKSIRHNLTPDKLEQLVKWYLERCGASAVWIPAKNESGKKDGADADIVAEFDNLNYIVYVQAKLHKDETSNWAVNQIDSYKNQKSEGDSAYTYATWVVSTADKFSDKAVADAAEKGVRLIDGKEFVRMLLDIGILDIDDAFE